MIGMFKKLFEKEKQLSWLAPMSGTMVPIENNPDPAFAGKMLGDGFCIDPSDHKIYAPADGEVMVFPTKHAIGIKMKNAYEILIHYGIDTVNLNGEGFTAHVSTGQQIKAGDLLLEVDVDKIKEKVPTLITAVVITNLNGKSIKLSKHNELKHGDEIRITIS